MTRTVKLTCARLVTFLVVVVALTLLGSHGSNGKLGYWTDNLLSILGRGPRWTAKLSRCKENLWLLDLYKQMWADDRRNLTNPTNDLPTWDDLRYYFTPRWSNGLPACQASGVYKINRLGEPPTCSIGGEGHSVR